MRNLATFVPPTIEGFINRNRGVSGARIGSFHNFKESPEMAPGYATETTVFKTDLGARLMDGELPNVKMDQTQWLDRRRLELYEDAEDLDFEGSTQGLGNLV